MTYPETRTFWMERTGEIAWGLRRYHSPEQRTSWDCAGGYHRALTYLGRSEAAFTEDSEGGRRSYAAQPMLDHADPRWPKTCDKCDYAFTDDDEWQMWQEGLYRRMDVPEEVVYVLHQGAPAPFAPSAPPGAMWDAWWMGDWAKGPDGICLMVRLPDGHDWMVDSEASNCTRPGDRTHRCWIRHGDPRSSEPHVTVDKNGETCAAGAGSIASPTGYHGFLRDGMLTAG